MELRHLEYFVAVAEERNFTRAAARVHVVQSAVSATIKALERELGAPLLDRDSKRVDLSLTPGLHSYRKHVWPSTPPAMPGMRYPKCAEDCAAPCASAP
jgi:DNA-binding transcriptional LysR family regulator